MSTTAASGQAFEEAIKVTPVDSHRYSANLRNEWCIGTGISPPNTLYLNTPLTEFNEQSPMVDIPLRFFIAWQ